MCRQPKPAPATDAPSVSQGTSAQKSKSSTARKDSNKVMRQLRRGNVEAVFDVEVKPAADKPNDPAPSLTIERVPLQMDKPLSERISEGTKAARAAKGHNTTMPRGTVKPGASVMKAFMARLESTAEKIENAVNTAALTAVQDTINEVSQDLINGSVNGASAEDVGLLFSGDDAEATAKAAVAKAMLRAATEAYEPYKEKRAPRKSKAAEGNGTEAAASEATA